MFFYPIFSYLSFFLFIELNNIELNKILTFSSSLLFQFFVLTFSFFSQYFSLSV